METYQHIYTIHTTTDEYRCLSGFEMRGDYIVADVQFPGEDEQTIWVPVCNVQYISDRKEPLLEGAIIWEPHR